MADADGVALGLADVALGLGEALELAGVALGLGEAAGAVVVDPPAETTATRARAATGAARSTRAFLISIRSERLT